MRAATELTKHNVNAGASEVRREHDRSCNHEMDRTRKSWLRFAMIAFAGLVAVTSYPPAKAAPPAAKEDLRPLVRAMTPDRVRHSKSVLHLPQATTCFPATRSASVSGTVRVGLSVE